MSIFLGGLNGDGFEDYDDTTGEDSCVVELTYCPRCGQGGLVDEGRGRLVVFEGRPGVATFAPVHACKPKRLAR